MSGVHRTPAITIIKEIRPNRFRLTDFNLRLRHPLNRFRFPFRSIISNQEIQIIRNAVWFLLARAGLPVIDNTFIGRFLMRCGDPTDRCVALRNQPKDALW